MEFVVRQKTYDTLSKFSLAWHCTGTASCTSSLSGRAFHFHGPLSADPLNNKVAQARRILAMYDLPSIFTLIQEPPSKAQWKQSPKLSKDIGNKSSRSIQVYTPLSECVTLPSTLSEALTYQLPQFQHPQWT